MANILVVNETNNISIPLPDCPTGIAMARLEINSE